jgi:hypothetical protein
MFVGGLIASVIVSRQRSRRPVSRLLPFGFATAYSIVVSLHDRKSVSDLIIFVLAANIAAGLLVFAVWVESSRKRGR